MVVPVGTTDNQVLTVVERVGDEIRQRTHGDCKFVKLVGKYAWDP
jgi:protein-L-isoaspartate O-methyltransferase